MFRETARYRVPIFTDEKLWKLRSVSWRTRDCRGNNFKMFNARHASFDKVGANFRRLVNARAKAFSLRNDDNHRGNEGSACE